jgi:predicted RNase H-like HicB family nuclease
MDLKQRSEAMAHYVGVLDGADDVWGVRIPDIPGCVGGGATPDAALADAIEALRDVVAHKRDGGYPVPPPSTLAAILASGEIGPDETAVRVPLFVDSGLRFAPT